MFPFSIPNWKISELTLFVFPALWSLTWSLGQSSCWTWYCFWFPTLWFAGSRNLFKLLERTAYQNAEDSKKQMSLCAEEGLGVIATTPYAWYATLNIQKTAVII